MPERAGFAQEAEPFRRELLAHCYRMLGSIQDAENLVQETYLRVWRSRGRFEGRSSMRTWLYQIATNRCLTELAKQSRRMLPSGVCGPELNRDATLEMARAEANWLQPAPDAMVLPGSADPAAIVAAHEGLRLALVARLQYLPPRQRAVLILRDVLAFPDADALERLLLEDATLEAAITNWDLVYKHQVHVIGLNIGALIQATPQIFGEVMGEVSRLLAAGVLGPGQLATYALADGPKALAELRARTTIGKLALLP